MTTIVNQLMKVTMLILVGIKNSATYSQNTGPRVCSKIIVYTMTATLRKKL